MFVVRSTTSCRPTLGRYVAVVSHLRHHPAEQYIISLCSSYLIALQAPIVTMRPLVTLVSLLQASLSAWATRSPTATTPCSSPTVLLDSATVYGVSDGYTNAFYGLRYAQAPYAKVLHNVPIFCPVLMDTPLTASVTFDSTFRLLTSRITGASMLRLLGTSAITSILPPLCQHG